MVLRRVELTGDHSDWDELITANLDGNRSGGRVKTAIKPWNLTPYKLFELEKRRAEFLYQGITSILTAMLISISTIALSAATDFDAPVLTGVAVDRTSVDVSSGSKIVTFTLSATDASDAIGYKNASMRLTLVKPDGSSLSKYVYWNRSSSTADDIGAYDAQTTVAGTIISHKSNQLVLSNEDLAGTWVLDHVYLDDSPGNYSHFYRADLDALGVKSVVVNLNDGVVSVGDLSLIAASPYESVYSKTVPAGGSASTTFGGTSVAISNVTLIGNNIWVTPEGHDFSNYSFSIRNQKAAPSKEVSLKIYSKGIYRAGFNQSAGASSCETSLNTDDLETVQTCVLSAFSANETRKYSLFLGTLNPNATARLNLEVYTSDPDSDGSDNHSFYDFRINYDNDQDGVGNDQDAFPNDGSEILDTDGDGIGDNGDNCASVRNRNQRDLDGDGRGDSCDADDDNDGVADYQDSFPLIALGGLTDTDSDGRPDDCNSDCQALGMSADLDDDGDGMSDALESANGLNPLNSEDCPRWHCGNLPVAIIAVTSAAFDIDGDGLTRAQEESAGTNWRLADSDGDGLTDGDEVSRSSNPLNSDSDADGLSDSREVELGTSAIIADTDGDSMSDSEEIVEGPSPTDGSDCPRWYCGGLNLPASIPPENK